jgi:hypothetical protein
MPLPSEIGQTGPTSLVGSGGVDGWKLRLALLFLVARCSDWRFPTLRTSASTLYRAFGSTSMICNLQYRRLAFHKPIAQLFDAGTR